MLALDGVITHGWISDHPFWRACIFPPRLSIRVLLNPVATGLTGQRNLVCLQTKTWLFQRVQLDCACEPTEGSSAQKDTLERVALQSSTDPVRKGIAGICGSHEAKERILSLLT